MFFFLIFFSKKLNLFQKFSVQYISTQFEIVGWSRHNDLNMDGGIWLGGKNDATINGKEIYRRILIRKK